MSKLLKKLIFNKYRVKKFIAETCFSSVYEGINEKGKEQVAMKFEKIAKQFNFLESEAFFLFNLKGFGIPKLISYGKNSSYNILIEELLGLSIDQIWNKKKIKIEQKLKDVCMLALQVIDRLEYIHSKNIIHRDMKPRNLLIGRKDPKTIYLIDFNFSRKYRSSRTGKHIKFGYTKIIMGSLRYSSISGNKGYEQSRKDDLESLGYILVYLAKNYIPWINSSQLPIDENSKISAIYKLKLSTSPEVLCMGLPEEFSLFIKYCKKLEFEQDPNYDYLRHLFTSILIRNEQKNDLNFAWIINKKLNIIKEEDSNESRLNYFRKRRGSSQKRLYNKIKESLEKENKKNELKSNSFNKFNFKNVFMSDKILTDEISNSNNNKKKKNNIIKINTEKQKNKLTPKFLKISTEDSNIYNINFNKKHKDFRNKTDENIRKSINQINNKVNLENNIRRNNYINGVSDFYKNNILNNIDLESQVLKLNINHNSNDNLISLKNKLNKLNVIKNKNLLNKNKTEKILYNKTYIPSNNKNINKIIFSNNKKICYKPLNEREKEKNKKNYLRRNYLNIDPDKSNTFNESKIDLINRIKSKYIDTNNNYCYTSIDGNKDNILGKPLIENKSYENIINNKSNKYLNSAIYTFHKNINSSNSLNYKKNSNQIKNNNIPKPNNKGNNDYSFNYKGMNFYIYKSNIFDKMNKNNLKKNNNNNILKNITETKSINNLINKNNSKLPLHMYNKLSSQDDLFNNSLLLKNKSYNIINNNRNSLLNNKYNYNINKGNVILKRYNIKNFNRSISDKNKYVIIKNNTINSLFN